MKIRKIWKIWNYDVTFDIAKRNWWGQKKIREFICFKTSSMKYVFLSILQGLSSLTQIKISTPYLFLSCLYGGEKPSSKNWIAKRRMVIKYWVAHLPLNYLTRPVLSVLVWGFWVKVLHIIMTFTEEVYWSVNKRHPKMFVFARKKPCSFNDSTLN